MNRVYYTDLSKDELIDFRQTLESHAIDIANEIAYVEKDEYFLKSLYLKTLRKLINTISLFMKADEDFKELCDEIEDICGFKY